MGSSGGGSVSRPNIPAPEAGMIAPQGQTAPFTPQYTNFLPQDPSAMATGITPDMVQSIRANEEARRMAQQQGPQGPPMQQQPDFASMFGEPPKPQGWNAVWQMAGVPEPFWNPRFSEQAQLRGDLAQIMASQGR